MALGVAIFDFEFHFAKYFRNAMWPYFSCHKTGLGGVETGARKTVET